MSIYSEDGTLKDLPGPVGDGDEDMDMDESPPPTDNMDTDEDSYPTNPPKAPSRDSKC